MAEQTTTEQIPPVGLAGQAELTIPDDLVAQVFRPRFPDATLCSAAAGMIPSQPAGHGQEGPSWRIVVSPGAVKVRTVDEAKRERTVEREISGQRKTVDAMAAYFGADDEIPEATPTRRITEFSRKSVNRLTEALCSVDYTPMFADPSRLPAMVTVTYPGCWLRVASSGKAVKAHLKVLRKRYQREFGEPLHAVWKMEFQGRREETRCDCATCAGRDDGRAPHVHLLMVPPRHASRDGRYFRQWLSETWAEVVAHPDSEHYARHLRSGTAVDIAEGMRSSDPKRVAVYFTKHGMQSGKQYQHLVPAAWIEDPANGPGRFWGYWNLERVECTVSVSAALGTVAGRTLRRWSAAQGVTRQVRRTGYRRGRADSAYPEVIGLAGAQFLAAHHPTRTRSTRTCAVRCRNGRGWVSVNDGATFAERLGTMLSKSLDYRDADHAAQYGRTLVARALRLPASLARDALVARLRARETRHEVTAR